MDNHRFVDGRDGFDRRLMEDLHLVGVRAYTVGRLTSAVNSVPPAIPVFIDWLRHLDERVPGPESRQRVTMRNTLIIALDDPAAKGNRDAIDALFEQLDRTSPPLETPVQIWATEILAKLATKDDYTTMLALLHRPGIEDGTRVAIVRYLGKYRKPESRDAALACLTYPIVRQEAIRTLGKVGTAADADTIAGYTHDDNPRVRNSVRTALAKLTKAQR